MKKKLLVVIQLLRKGGVELAAINFAENLDKNLYDITFLLISPYGSAQDDRLADKLASDGFKIVSVPKECNGYIKKYKYLLEFMRKEKYDIIHSHVLFFSGIVLTAAKKAGIKVRAAHSHAVKWNKKKNLEFCIYSRFMRLLLRKNCNLKLACCQRAGEFLYGKNEYNKNGIFIPNGIDLSKFSYNEPFRDEIRHEFAVADDEKFIGHIGTVYKIKNQSFLIDVFNEMLKKDNKLKLIMVGEKLDAEVVENKIAEYGLTDKVIFASQRADVYKFYSALDIMIFPSLHEALPLSLIETQSAQLPCLISDSVTKDVKANENVRFLSLDKSPEEWAQAAFDLLKNDRLSVSTDVLKSNFNIENICKELQKLYSETE